MGRGKGRERGAGGGRGERHTRIVMGGGLREGVIEGEGDAKQVLGRERGARWEVSVRSEGDMGRERC